MCIFIIVMTAARHPAVIKIDCFHTHISIEIHTHRSHHSVVTQWLLFPSCLHAAVQQWADGAATDSPLLLLFCSISLPISLSSFSPAVLQPFTPVVPHYFAACSLRSGTHHSSVLLLSQLQQRTQHSEESNVEHAAKWSIDSDVGEEYKSSVGFPWLHIVRLKCKNNALSSLLSTQHCGDNTFLLTMRNLVILLMPPSLPHSSSLSFSII